MQPVSPPCIIACCDLWPPGRLSPLKLAAYKRLINDGVIRIRRVVHHPRTGFTVVDYLSQLPHAWTLSLLRDTAALLDPGQQQSLEDLP